MSTKIDNQIKSFLEESNIIEAYESFLCSNFLSQLEGFISSKSVEEQQYALNVILGETDIDFRIRHWHIHPITLWMKEKLAKLQELETSIQSKDKARHKQQMLILHYLGILDKIDLLPLNQGGKAQLLSTLLNRSEKNTNNYLASIALTMATEQTDVAKTPKNLNFVLNLFKELGLTDYTGSIQSDLNKTN